MRKNINIYFLLLFLVLGLFIPSCQKPDNAEDSTDTSCPLVSSETNDSEPFKLTDNGEACFKIIRPDDADDKTSELALNFRNKLQKKLGVEVQLNSDLTISGSHSDDTYEILVGCTSYSQVEELESKLRANDGIVTLCGRKIIILAHNSETLNKAINWFMNYAMPLAEKDDSGDWSLTFDTYELQGEYTLPALKLQEHEITEYNIIYSVTNPMYKEAASEIGERLSDATGYMLSVLPETDPVTECEIVVGPTSRTETRAENGTYSLYFSDNKLIFDIFGIVSARNAADDLISYLKTNNITNIPDTFKLTKTWGDTEAVLLQESATVRLMSFNVLSQRYSTVDYTAERAELLGLMLEKYRPDAAGLQEACAYWKKYLSIYGGRYSLIGAARSDGTDNYSVLIYDSERYDVIAQGVVSYKDGSSDYNSNSAYGIFKSKDGSKIFGMISTHWNPPGTGTNYENQHNSQAEELSSLIESLHAEYACPIFVTGDFNCKPSDASMIYFQSFAPVWDSRTAAETALNNLGTIPGFRQPATEGGSIIDYIFGTNDAHSKSYFVVSDSYIQEISDHRPVFTDVTLK